MGQAGCPAASLEELTAGPHLSPSKAWLTAHAGEHPVLMMLAHTRCSRALLMMAAAPSPAGGSLLTRESTPGRPQPAWGHLGKDHRGWVGFCRWPVRSGKASSILSIRAWQEGSATPLSPASGPRPCPPRGACRRGPTDWGFGTHRRQNQNHIFLCWKTERDKFGK